MSAIEYSTNSWLENSTEEGYYCWKTKEAKRERRDWREIFRKEEKMVTLSSRYRMATKAGSIMHTKFE